MQPNNLFSPLLPLLTAAEAEAEGREGEGGVLKLGLEATAVLLKSVAGAISGEFTWRSSTTVFVSCSMSRVQPCLRPLCHAEHHQRCSPIRDATERPGCGRLQLAADAVMRLASGHRCARPDRVAC